MTDDLFGKALYAFSKGDRSEFSFLLSDGTKEVFSLQRYFRNAFTPLEERMLRLAHGDILDVGCATGYYLHILMARGAVTALDISPGALQVAREQGLACCIQADIWEFDAGRRYDTITLFENNLGIAGTLERAKLLLLHLKSLLKPGGQILLQHWNLGVPYAEAIITPCWKDQTGDPFPWVHMSVEKLKVLCSACGLDAVVLEQSGHYALVRMCSSSP